MEPLSKSTIKYFFIKDEKAVSEVYSKTYRLLFHIALSYLKNREDAEDIVIETYSKAMNTPYEKIKKQDQFISFISTICKNLCLDLLRKRKNESAFEVNEEMVSSVDIYHDPLIEEIRKSMTDTQFNVFIYRVYFGLSYKEISPLVRKTIGRCRTLYNEAKEIIKTKKELFYE